MKESSQRSCVPTAQGTAFPSLIWWQCKHTWKWNAKGCVFCSFLLPATPAHHECAITLSRLDRCAKCSYLMHKLCLLTILILWIPNLLWMVITACLSGSGHVSICQSLAGFRALFAQIKRQYSNLFPLSAYKRQETWISRKCNAGTLHKNQETNYRIVLPYSLM